MPFSDLATAAYCPRKLYYERRDADRDVPDRVERVREMAFAYDDLVEADRDDLAARPIAVSPASFARRLRASRDRHADAWSELVDPAERDVVVEGRDCRGVVQKVLALDPPAPALVSAGEPPDAGVWATQSVRATAAAAAVSWRERERVDRAFVEYPAYGDVREVRITARRRAAYRRTLRTVRSLDGPPARIDSETKCGACEYSDECGVRTRSLRSLL